MGKLHELRTELVEQAFVLDRQGSPTAAEVALTISARLEELCEEVSSGFSGDTVRNAPLESLKS